MTQEVIGQETATTAIIVANVGELAAAVMHRVAGNDISSALNGQSLTREAVQTLAISKFREVAVKDLKS